MRVITYSRHRESTEVVTPSEGGRAEIEDMAGHQCQESEAEAQDLSHVIHIIHNLVLFRIHVLHGSRLVCGIW